MLDILSFPGCSFFYHEGLSPIFDLWLPGLSVSAPETYGPRIAHNRLDLTLTDRVREEGWSRGQILYIQMALLSLSSHIYLFSKQIFIE